MVLISMRKIKRNDKRRVMTSLYVKSSTVNFHRPVHSIAYADHHLRRRMRISAREQWKPEADGSMKSSG